MEVKMGRREEQTSTRTAQLSIQTLFKPIAPLISAFVALTSIGALNASIMGHSRLLFAGARVGHMPVILGMIHSKFLTPWPAIFVLLGWGLAMLFFGGVTDMMEFIGLFYTIMAISCVQSLLYLRLKRPDEHRPYKTFTLIPVIQLLVNIAMLFLAIYQKPIRMGFGLAILFAGIPVYLFRVVWKNKPKIFTSLVREMTILAQKILNIKTTGSQAVIIGDQLNVMDRPDLISNPVSWSEVTTIINVNIRLVQFLKGRPCQKEDFSSLPRLFCFAEACS